ncbi:hypothetical protein PPERSA_02524 [Pseudocohnilembus persalinus]|uniref:Uncharacterized protein n=1 Tax=Pseudocohnilembus persalinus TaxID=266149 RepID=A0A0V0R588_PSEPJ|nr:hypothetical protein PPERSA_02524 [Pseudocohnilembus persalinus]|eukprot:KRX09652.1 hypothetical protein PPERSA_02524 [Pseudocohnilembus persalinus]
MNLITNNSLEFSKFHKRTNSEKRPLFDIKECEHLFQKDKSKKQKQDISQIQQHIVDLKNDEEQFYSNLLIDDQYKESFFRVNSNINIKNEIPKKIIACDPVYGNLILTEQEYIERYGQKN